MHSFAAQRPIIAFRGWMVSITLLTGCSGKSTDSATDGNGSTTGNGDGSGTTVTSAEEDADSDGYAVDADCDDNDAAVHPDAEELCDGKDTNCDGSLHPLEGDDDNDGIPDCSACADASFWSVVLSDITGDELQAALTDALPETTCDYYQSKQGIYTSFDLEDGNVVECVYTGQTVSIIGGSPEGDAMNIEHTWPRSEGADAQPADCDVHHLYPTMTDANAARQSHPLGEVTGTVSWSSGGSKVGTGSGGTVFEPRDTHKGNAARSMLYVWLQYGYAPTSAQRTLYQSWSELDPVTSRDQVRDASIGRYQGSQNPFVACPTLTGRMLDAR
ncbi:MAG: hypothetical protein CL927_13640 [Deltaproteobacteria bacterium]|nr:hypothetical protein [Deltaproteobacteria bacterium]